MYILYALLLVLGTGTLVIAYEHTKTWEEQRAIKYCALSYALFAIALFI